MDRQMQRIPRRAMNLNRQMLHCIQNTCKNDVEGKKVTDGAFGNSYKTCSPAVVASM